MDAARPTAHGNYGAREPSDVELNEQTREAWALPVLCRWGAQLGALEEIENTNQADLRR